MGGRISRLHGRGPAGSPSRPTGIDAEQGPGVLGVGNRHATHPVNAMLNYGYSILEAEVRISVLTAGLDPEIGYLHTNRKGRLSVVYDLMEPLRPVVDRGILNLLVTTSSRRMTSRSRSGVSVGFIHNLSGGWSRSYRRPTSRRYQRTSSRWHCRLHNRSVWIQPHLIGLVPARGTSSTVLPWNTLR
jgi:hypothetical protein